ncbi:hypothetical protein, partial [Veillonella sp.]
MSGLVGAFLLGALGTADASLITTDEGQMDMRYGDTRQAYDSIGWDSGHGVQYKLLVKGAENGGDKKVATRTQRGDAPIENRYQVLKIGLDAATLKKINDSSSNSQTAIDELKNKANRDLDNLSEAGEKKLSDLVKGIKTGSTNLTAGSENIKIAESENADGTKSFSVDLNKKVNLTADGSVTVGNTKLDKSGLEAGETKVKANGILVGKTALTAGGLVLGNTVVAADGLTVAGGPSVTTAGIDAGGKKVSNVGEGAVAEGSTDAVTGGQLFGVQKDLNDSIKGAQDTANSALQSVTVTDTKGQTLVVNKDNAGFGIVGAKDGMVESKVSGQNLVVDLTDATKEKINNAAGKDLGNLDDKGKTVIKEVVQESVNVDGGNNISVVDATDKDGVKTFTVNLDKNINLGTDGSVAVGDTKLDKSSLEIGATKVAADGVSVGDAALTTDGLAIVGGPSVTKDGIDAGGKVVGNLGEGAVAEGSKDAVTGGQLFGMQKDLNDSIKGAQDTANSALQSVSVKDGAGNVLTVNKDNAGFGIVGATDGMVESKVSGQDLVVDLTAATKEKINNAAGKDLGNLDDKGKTVIKEVVQESVDVAGGNNIEVTDAVNNEGVKTFTVNMKNNVDLGANGSIKAGATTLDASGLIAGATKVGADGVSVGDAALTTDGLAIVGGPSVTKDGINAGGKVVGNLGEGAVAEGSKDAVTGGQLYGVKTELDDKVNTVTNEVNTIKTDVGTLKTEVTTVKNDVGTLKTEVTNVKTDVGTIRTDVNTLTDRVTTVENTAGSALQTVTVTDTNGQKLVVNKDNAGFGIKGATDGMVTSEVSGRDLVVDLTAATKEKINNAAGKDLGNLDDKGKTVIKEVVQDAVDVKGGSNINVDKATVDGVKTFTVNLDKNLDLGGEGSITLGDTIIKSGDVKVGGTTINNGGVTLNSNGEFKVGDTVINGSTINVGGTTLNQGGLTIKNGPSINVGSINMGGTKITNVANATEEGDVVTYNQLQEVKNIANEGSKLANSALQTVTVKGNDGQTIAISKSNSAIGIIGAADGMVESKVNGNDLVVDLTATTKEKINNAAGKDLGNLDDKGKEVIKEVSQDAVDVVGGNNITVDTEKADDVKTFTVNLNKDLNLGGEGSITLGDTVIKSGDLHVGGTT